jgi:VIT1/CCC1 family predicted Fe2+/Mn2+ transporter
MKKIEGKTKLLLLKFQQGEITENLVYSKLAKMEKDPNNRKILEGIGIEERAHYKLLTQYTGENPKPNKWRVRKFVGIARIFGLTFALKLMENNESKAITAYDQFEDYPEITHLSKEEEEHEQKLINLIDEERLRYMGSVVLGLNDALVEFTGALAGYTLALNNTKLIALTGSITGIAAALSMSSSEFLSKRSEGNMNEKPLKASAYTGIAYIITVIALVSPFVMFTNPILSVAVMLCFALIIIAVFNYYYAIARSEKFIHRFGEMALLSFSVAALSFVIGYALKQITGIES